MAKASPKAEPGESPPDLRPCPACGKNEGKLLERLGARFPFAIQCGAYGWVTEFVTIPGVAEKLWNEPKRQRKGKASG